MREEAVRRIAEFAASLDVDDLLPMSSWRLMGSSSREEVVVDA